MSNAGKRFHGMVALSICSFVIGIQSPTAQGQTEICCGPPTNAALAPAIARKKIAKSQERLRALFDDSGIQREVEPAALAQALDHHLERCFRFVRDELLFHPYRGALRGGQGALLAGAANDVDRCLLLAELLRQGPDPAKVRFAFGNLTREQAQMLADRALRAAPGKPAYQAADVRPLLRQTDTTPDDLAQSDLQLGRMAQPYVLELIEGYSADLKTIESALARAKLSIQGSEQDSVESHVEKLQEHTWLQVYCDNQWVDLDPSFAHAKMGWKPVEPERLAGSIPPDEHCRLNVKLVAEQLAGDKLKTTVLYERHYETIDLTGQSISLTVMPENFKWEKFTDAPAKVSPLLAMSPEFDRYQIVIDLAGRREQSRLFDVKGRVFESRGGAFAELGNIAGSRVSGLLGGRGPFGRRSAEPDNALSGLRLELTRIVPGEQPRTDVRYFLDRLQPGTRDSKPVLAERWKDEVRTRLSLVQSWTLWPATGPLNHAFLFDRMYRLVGPRGGVDLIFELAEGSDDERWRHIADHVDPLPLSVIGFSQTAQMLSQGAVEPGQGACFIAEPALYLWKEALTLRDSDEVGFRRGVDIVAAPLGCIATNTRDAARARTVFGLLLSEGESATVGRQSPHVISAARVFQKARASGTPVVILNSDDPTNIESLAVSEEAKVRLREELHRGYIVLTPQASVSLGDRSVTAWWRIDAETGMCLGIGETGEGQATSEGVLVLENISIPMVENVMKFVACFNAGIGGGKSIQQAGSECGMQFMKDYLKQVLESAISQFILTPSFYDDGVGPETTGEGADWLAGTSPGHRGLRESQAISDKMNESGFAQLLDKARRHYGNYEGLKGLAGKVNLLLTFGNEIAQVAAATQSK